MSLLDNLKDKIGDGDDNIENKPLRKPTKKPGEKSGRDKRSKNQRGRRKSGQNTPPVNQNSGSPSRPPKNTGSGMKRSDNLGSSPGGRRSDKPGPGGGTEPGRQSKKESGSLPPLGDSDKPEKPVQENKGIPGSVGQSSRPDTGSAGGVPGSMEQPPGPENESDRTVPGGEPFENRGRPQKPDERSRNPRSSDKSAGSGSGVDDDKIEILLDQNEEMIDLLYDIRDKL